LKQFVNLFTRVGELLANKPFRTHGEPSQDITRICNPVMGQPSAGSFQFDLHFESPYQFSLFDSVAPFSPRALVETSYVLMEECVKEDFGAFREHVQDVTYASHILRLLRNLSPSS